MWQFAARRSSDEIELEDARQGEADASLLFQDAVCAPAYDGLTTAQRQFLLAMRPDFPGSSRVSNVAKRVGKSQSWANKYRARLIGDQIIEADARGFVRLCVPFMDAYLDRVAQKLGAE